MEQNELTSPSPDAFAEALAGYETEDAAADINADVAGVANGAEAAADMSAGASTGTVDRANDAPEDVRREARPREAENHNEMNVPVPEAEPEPAGAQEPAGASLAAPSPARDFEAEVAELLSAFPELDHRELPEEVFTESVQGGTRVALSYAKHQMKALASEAERLRAENASLRERLDARRRAPVTGSAGSGSPMEGPRDYFAEAFDRT